MKIKSILILLIVALVGVASASAQEESLVGNDFDGLWFQLPAGCKVEKGSEFKAIYADGTFGLTMKKIAQPSTRKISMELCKRAADSMHISRNGVQKATFGGVKGVKAEGVIEGKSVTIIVLPYDEHQVQIVMMADPSRSAWVDAFLNSLKKS